MTLHVIYWWMIRTQKNMFYFFNTTFLFEFSFLTQVGNNTFPILKYYVWTWERQYAVMIHKIKYNRVIFKPSQIKILNLIAAAYPQKYFSFSEYMNFYTKPL